MDFYDLKFLLSKENLSACVTKDTAYPKFKEIAEILNFPEQASSADAVRKRTGQ